MYIHLGRDTVVTSKSIIGIFDIDNCSISKRTREFLKKAEEANRVTNVTDDLPKSFVICKTDEGTKVFISGISPATLKKRAGYIDGLGV